jgi:hypothetical protein
MTSRDAERIAAQMDARMRPWVAKAVTLIRGNAITETLRNTPDGRATARKATNSPSYVAATKRLHELADALAGPSKTSLEGLIRDARADFYREAFKLWTPIIPENLRNPKATPTQKGEDAARGAIILGRDPRLDLVGLADDSERSLFAAVNLAGRKSANDRLVKDLLDTWRDRVAQRFVNQVAMMLSDSDTSIHYVVGRLMIKPELSSKLKG